MEIVPNQGIGNLRFGMRPAEIRAVMGDKFVYEDWMGTGHDEALYYPGIMFCFDKSDGYRPLEDAKLFEIWIDVSFKNITYKGVALFELTMEAIKELLDKEGTSYYITGNSEIAGISLKAYQLDFSFESEQLVQINLDAPKT